MKSAAKQSNEAEREAPGEMVTDYLVTCLKYTVAAILIYAIGHFFWWPGLILFVGFALMIVQRLLLVGVVAVIEVVVSLASIATIRKRGIDMNNADKLKEPVVNVLKMNLVMGFFEIYLFAITVVLGGSFFYS